MNEMKQTNKQTKRNCYTNQPKKDKSIVKDAALVDMFL